MDSVIVVRLGVGRGDGHVDAQLLMWLVVGSVMGSGMGLVVGLVVGSVMWSFMMPVTSGQMSEVFRINHSDVWCQCRECFTNI